MTIAEPRTCGDRLAALVGWVVVGVVVLLTFALWGLLVGMLWESRADLDLNAGSIGWLVVAVVPPPAILATAILRRAWRDGADVWVYTLAMFFAGLLTMCWAGMTGFGLQLGGY